MSGKYIEFELPNGKKINGKVAFCEHEGISIATLSRKMKTENDSFYHNGFDYTYRYVFENIEKRKYTPNPEGKNAFQKAVKKHFVKKEIDTNKVLKFSENMVFEYSWKKKSLINTFSRDRFEMLITKIFGLIDARYLE